MAKRDPREKEGQKKQSFEDDGRTVADMSGIGRPGFFGRTADGAHGGASSGGARGRTFAGDPPRQSGDPGRQSAAQNYEQPLTKKERLLCALGALKAALLIGLVYIVGLGLVILALIALWR